ncbi:MAG: hypothetical protein PHW04_01085, partial [Candidatus Wallbacteria bacterium]|nr:hypothetical protein [Candidatus Wallbacteria bacterium]
AVLRKITPVYRTDRSGNTEIIDYYVCFTRVVDGCEVLGKRGDGIGILVGSEGVESCMKIWRKIESSGSRGIQKLLPPQQALENAKADIMKKDSSNIFAWTLGYYSPDFDEKASVEMKPCYHFYTASGAIFHVDAVTGVLL